MGASAKGASSGGPTLEYFVLKRKTRETLTSTLLQHESLTFDESTVFLRLPEMDSGRRKGPICGVENCRSRIYDEGEDGYRYCENGHRKGVSYRIERLGSIMVDYVLVGSCRRSRRG